MARLPRGDGPLPTRVASTTALTVPICWMEDNGRNSVAEQHATGGAGEPIEVGRFTTRASAEQHALVLLAVGIGCRLQRAAGTVALLVAPEDAERARWQLACYERENTGSPVSPVPARPLLYGLEAALAYCAVLTFFFAAQQREAFGIDWTTIGAAQAGLIRAGAWWRTITALTLHADLGHLAGNVGFGVLFAMLASQLLGAGLAWLGMVIAGALGNTLDAFLQSPDHTSIGASTAIFAAVGMLSGHLRRSRRVPWRGGLHRWAPLSAGILLLVFLGTSGARTDVGAHVAGFATGGFLGLALAQLADRVPHGPRAQWLYGIAAGCLLAVAWLRAILGQP